MRRSSWVESATPSAAIRWVLRAPNEPKACIAPNRAKPASWSVELFVWLVRRPHSVRNYHVPSIGRGWSGRPAPRPSAQEATAPPRDATGWWILKNGVCGATISRSAWGARVVFLLWRLRLPPHRRVRARRWLSRPWDAIDLVRLTVDVGCAAICWRARAGGARSFLGVELAGHVVAGASA